MYSTAVAELARLRVAAENPVLVADRLARTPAAMPLLIELAETLARRCRRGGIGYGTPASVGAALANKRHGRLSVAIQTDGDLMYAPVCCGNLIKIIDSASGTTWLMSSTALCRLAARGAWRTL